MRHVDGQWDRDEEFRQSVIRKALLLGFSCTEIKGSTLNPEHRYTFMFGGTLRAAYPSIYSAAFDYLRLMKVPPDIIGDYRG